MGAARINAAGQVKIYLGKCFRLFTNEKQWKNFISALLIVLIISFVTSKDMFVEYLDTKNGAFAVICGCIWIGLFNSIQSICRERAIIKREYRTGLRISSYVIAHVIYELFLCAVETLIVLVVMIISVYIKKDSGEDMPTGVILSFATDMYFTLFLVTFGSDMIALLISCIVKDGNTAMTVMPFVLIIQLVMSGAVFKLEGAGDVISNLTLSKWGLNSIICIANTSNSVKSSYDSAEIFAERTYLPGCEPEAGKLFGFLGIMLLFTALYILLSMLVLRRVDKDQR